MHSDLFTDALARCLELLDDPAAGVDPRAEFETGFAAALHRLEETRRDPGGREAESLLSALGAAAVEQWELALAFLAAAARAASDGRSVRRAIVPLATLRRRFRAVVRQR
jgi:hypothetical protein